MKKLLIASVLASALASTAAFAHNPGSFSGPQGPNVNGINAEFLIFASYYSGNNQPKKAETAYDDKGNIASYTLTLAQAPAPTDLSTAVKNVNKIETGDVSWKATRAQLTLMQDKKAIASYKVTMTENEVKFTAAQEAQTENTGKPAARMAP